MNYVRVQKLYFLNYSQHHRGNTTPIILFFSISFIWHLTFWRQPHRSFRYQRKKLSSRGIFERYALLLHYPWKWDPDSGRPFVLQLETKSECVSTFDKYIRILQMTSCAPTQSTTASSTPSGSPSSETSPPTSLPDSLRVTSVSSCPTESSTALPDTSSDTVNSDSDSETPPLNLQLQYSMATRARNRLAWITTLASGIAPDDNDKRMCSQYRNRVVDKWDSINDPESFFTANQTRTADKNRPNTSERLKAERAINRLNAQARQDEGIPLKKLEVMVHSETSARHVRQLLNRTTTPNLKVSASKVSCVTNFTAAEIKCKYKLLEDDNSLQVATLVYFHTRWSWSWKVYPNQYDNRICKGTPTSYYKGGAHGLSCEFNRRFYHSSSYWFEI